MHGLSSIKNYNFKPEFDISDEYNKIRFLESGITKNMLDMAENLNTSFAGLEYSVKSASSIEDKIKRKMKDAKMLGNEIDAKEAFDSFTDLIRYTEICEHDKICDVTKQTIDYLENKGYVLSAIKNYYLHPYESTGYKGMHLLFITPTGHEIEMQIHSKESFEIKQKSHELYENIRCVATPVEVKEQLMQQIRDIHADIKDPVGFETITYKNLNKKKMSKEEIELIKKSKQIEYKYETQKEEDFETYLFDYTYEDIHVKGFETRFFDDSVIRFENINEDDAKFYVVSPEGHEVGWQKIDLFKNKEFNMQSVLDIANIQLNKHNNWIQKNEYIGEIEDDIEVDNNFKQDER